MSNSINFADALNIFKKQIDNWVDSLLPSTYPKDFPSPTSYKTIREAVLGYHILPPHEYLILDTPIVQRIRYIHQTALTYLIYPTALHTRFDHSLGVARIAERIGRSINLKESQIDELRLAGLLHDVGHCFFSHISEGLIKTKFDSEFMKIKEDPLFEDSKIHEILSYLIVTSPSFTHILKKICKHYGKNIDPENVGLLILGKPKKPELQAQMGDIIHGPFDADKLDYLVRDCYFTGIRADIDVDRVVICVESLDRAKFPSYPYSNLIMTKTGVSNLEQIILNKILLFSSIYHHHKVRAIECMVKAIFEIIWDDPSKIKNPLLRFGKLTDYLSVSEYDLFSLGMLEKSLLPAIKNLLDRNLIKRSLVITPNYIEENSNLEQHDLFRLGEEYPNMINELRKFIWEEIPVKYRSSFHDLWIDIPEPPNADEDVDRCWIDAGTKELIRLRKFLPYGEWLDAYEANKLQGHVFYSPDIKHRKAANNAARKVFNNLYKIKFTPAATDYCKL